MALPAHSRSETGQPQGDSHRDEKGIVPREPEMPEDAEASGRYCLGAAEDMSSAVMIMEMSFKGCLHILFHMFLLQIAYISSHNSQVSETR